MPTFLSGFVERHQKEASAKINHLFLILLFQVLISKKNREQEIFGIKLWLSVSFYLLSFTSLALKAEAQIVPDGTLPNSSVVTPQGNVNVIEGGSRAGGNLFHSFQEFSVPTGTEAFFNNAGDIQNIFSRVTGRSISNIDGLIRANGTANLFLLNPNGIIFGPNARLNIGGSFLASTANSFKFADGIEFSATNPQGTPLLSINIPIGLQYGKNPGEIRAQGKGQDFLGTFGTFVNLETSLIPLEVLPGKNLTLVGGNVVIDGGILQAPGGRVDLGGVLDEGTVELNTDGSLTFPSDVIRADILITNKAGINVMAAGEGSMTISARNLDIAENSLLIAGVKTEKESVDTTAGDITLNTTEAMTITSSHVKNIVYYDAKGTSGNINIMADSVSFHNNGSLDTSTYSEGIGNSINIIAREIVSFDSFGGYGSNIKITTELFSLKNSTLLSSASTGSKQSGSHVIISASDTINLGKGANVFSENIQFLTGKLIVGDGVRVSSSASEETSGSLTVKAGNSVEISGIDIPTILFTNTATPQTGGNLTIETGQLTVRGNVEILTSTEGVANAGDLIIRASDFVKVSQGGAILSLTSVNSTGAGGNLTIETQRFEGTPPILRSLGQGTVGSLTMISPEFFPTIIKSQIVPDQTLPINSIVREEANNINVIEGGTTVGSNLFHSFAEFSVPITTTAYFNNASDIKNIISRVTGESVSQVNGFLQANGTANLFLLNPNGIIFGSNARLNLGGSFLVSTANSIKFDDGSFFSATNPNSPSPLAINLPIGLQFAVDSSHPNAVITVQGTGYNASPNLNIGGYATRDDQVVGLAVSTNQTLAVVGGEVKLEGGILTAQEGRIELGSVAPGNFVTLTPTSTEGNDWQLGYEGVQNFQDISLKSAALVDASGSGGGSIQVQGRRISLDDGSVIASSTEGNNSGGNLTMRAAESLEMMGASPNNQVISLNSGVSNGVGPEATGIGGNLTIDTGRLTLKDGAQISTGTVGQGKSGNLTVIARDIIEAIGRNASDQFGSGLYTITLSTGDGGHLTIDTGRLVVKGAQIGTGTYGKNGKGKGGNLTITARDAVEVIGILTEGFNKDTPGNLFTTTSSTGNGGNLTINTGQLIVKDGSGIDTGTFGPGKAGNLTITARDAVIVSGIVSDSEVGQFPSRLSASAIADPFFLAAPPTGDGGNLTINTGRLIIKDQATVNVYSDGAGKAGTLQVFANSIELSNQASLDANTKGGGGSIQLFAPTITLRNSSITTNASSGDRGGDISVSSQFLQLRDGSTITTNAIGTEVQGGNITLNTDILTALENSDITANAQEGKGGVITIKAQGIFGTQFRVANTSKSDITATGKSSSLSGTVQINSPEIDPNTGLVNLPKNVVDTSRLLAKSCIARRRETGTFYIIGTGSLPTRPGDAVVSPYSTGSVRSLSGASTSNSNSSELSASEWQLNEQIVEAQGVYKLENGQLVLGYSCPD